MTPEPQIPATDTQVQATDTQTYEEKRGRHANEIMFPRRSLMKALEISKAIERDNAGDPYDPILLASKSLKSSPRSSSFEILLAASERYGLTKGNSRAKAVHLTPLGSAIVAPTDDTKTGSNLRTALLKTKLFEQVYSKYDRKNIPREEIVKNTLIKEFNVPREDVDACYDVIMKNIQDYNLVVKSGDNQILYLDNLGKVQLEQSKPELEQAVDDIQQSTSEPSVPLEKIEEKQVPKQIFVAHGKNTKPLEQLEKILNKFKVNYKVAVEEAHSGRPISTKVAELMKTSTSGIFIFTADEKTIDAEGNEIWRPSDNVVYELGAASVLYGNKIVIFKESDVKFASDFNDLGYISFEKDRLDAKAADLMIELINLGFMQLTPT